MNFLDILRTLTGADNYFAAPDQARAVAGPGGMPVAYPAHPVTPTPKQGGTPGDGYAQTLNGQMSPDLGNMLTAITQPMGTPQDSYLSGYGNGQPAQPLPHPGQDMQGTPQQPATPLQHPGQNAIALDHPGQDAGNPLAALAQRFGGSQQLAGADPNSGFMAALLGNSGQQGQPGFPPAPVPGAVPPAIDQTATGSTAAPSPQPAAQPSLLDRFSNFTHSPRGQALADMFAGWAQGSTPQQSLGYGAKMMAGNRDKRQQVNDTVNWLTSQGMDKAEAQALARNPTLLSATLKSMVGQKPTSDIQNYQFAVQTGYKGSFAEWQKSGKGASYGQSPIILTDPNGKMHMGQMSSGGGMLVDGKTYSTLPPDWKVGTVSQSGSGGLSPETLDILATQYLAGDKSAIQGFSRNANMRAQLANAIAKKADAMGMDGKSIAAEISAYGGNVAAQRSAGTRAAQVGMAASEANKMADVALEASQSVPRGAFVPWNKAVNAYRTGTSSPQMAAFVTATTSLVNAYARAISPLGAPTDAMRQHAEEMLNTAQSPQAYAAVINQMKKEMEAALNAPAEISDQLKKQVTGGHEGQSAPAAPAPQGGVAPGHYRFNPQTGTLEPAQ